MRVHMGINARILYFIEEFCYNPVFDSYTYKIPSKILINSAFFEGLFALKM